MIRYYYRTLFLLILFSVSLGNLNAQAVDPEVRGVWLTTNMGLDWPAGEYDPARQKARLTEILDCLKECNFNLVIFQVEANGDALWDSSFEPAMRSVTGDGKKSLKYDVGKFVVDECHRRGMECHAWIVPFRTGTAKNATAYSGNPTQHPYYSCAGFSIDYDGCRYLDPGNPLTMQFLKQLYSEFLRDCPYDGISLDYTRYPGDRFPDETSYKRYAPKGMNRDDWRRDNINRFVAMFDSIAQAIKPGIMIGSAPIGTYRNVGKWKNATAYGSFQQDPAAWIDAGNHDIIIPQMYWGENRGFSDHLATWADVAGDTATLVVGLAPYKMVDGSRWTASDIENLITTARSYPGVSGVCFFRAEHITGNNPEVKKLRHHLATLFSHPAPLPWHQ